MIKFDGMRAEAANNGNQTKFLPAGPYVAKVIDVRIEGQAPDQMLAVVLDITEGEYAGWFMKKYREQKERGSNYEIKYKGIIRIRIPNSANTRAMYPESDIRRFNDMIFRFEKSNDGYHWDGDETKLKGLTVGISMQESSYNGSVFTKIARFEIADDVRQGVVRVMSPKGEGGNQPDPTTAPAVMDQRSGMEVVTEALPWDEKPY